MTSRRRPLIFGRALHHRQRSRALDRAWAEVAQQEAALMDARDALAFEVEMFEEAVGTVGDNRSEEIAALEQIRQESRVLRALQRATLPFDPTAADALRNADAVLATALAEVVALAQQLAELNAPEIPPVTVECDDLGDIPF